MSLLVELWRHLTATSPAYHRAYLKLPTRRPDGRDIGAAAADLAHGFESAFDGRLDVYAAPEHVLIDTDFVPTERFDPAAFERGLGRLRDRYAESFYLPELTRRATHAGEPAAVHLVVPVAPLFAARWAEREQDSSDRSRPPSPHDAARE